MVTGQPEAEGVMIKVGLMKTAAALTNLKLQPRPMLVPIPPALQVLRVSSKVKTNIGYCSVF